MKVKPNGKIRIQKCGAIFACLLELATFGTAEAQTYDAVKDFSLKNNPNGVWSYGSLSDVTGGEFTLFSSRQENRDFNGEWVWSNGGENPDSISDTLNTSGKPVKISVTVILPTDQINIDGENHIAALRFTAPATGTYNVAGRFERTDIFANPVNVYIVKNGTEPLFSAAHFTGYGAREPFNGVGRVYLTAGSTLDFVESASQYNNDSTGVDVRITLASGSGAPGATASIVSAASTPLKPEGPKPANDIRVQEVSAKAASPSGKSPDSGAGETALTRGTGETEHYAVSISGALSTEALSGTNSTFKTSPISNAAILKNLVLSDTTGTLKVADLDIVFDPLDFELDVISKTSHQVVATLGGQGPGFSKVTELASVSDAGENATQCYTDYEVFFPGITAAAQSLTIVFHASRMNMPAYNPGSGFNISFVGGNGNAPDQFIQGSIRKGKASYTY